MNLGRGARRARSRTCAGHKLRAALTMLGIVFGVGAVIAMLAIGGGAERQALETIDRLGRRNLILRAKELKTEELRETRKRSVGLARRDVEAIAAGIPGVEEVAPKIEVAPYEIFSASGRAKGAVLGVAASYPRFVDLRLAEGRFFDALDERDFAQVCVLGAALRRELFGWGAGARRPGQGQRRLARGGRRPAPSRARGRRHLRGDDASAPRARVLYLPAPTAERKFERDPQASPYSEILVRLGAAVDPLRRGPRARPSWWTACTPAPTTPSWSCPRRCSSRAGRRSGCSTW